MGQFDVDGELGATTRVLSEDKRVERIDCGVARPWGAHSAHVRALLSYLRGRGLNVPEVLDRDEMGRDVVAFIEGEQVHPRHWTDEGLMGVGRMIARLHAAARGFQPEGGAVWQPWCLRELGAPSLISHGDIAPWNVITKGGLPVALIDWEFAGPVDPMMELARACWLFAQLVDNDLAALHGLPNPAGRARQVRLMLDAYGLDVEGRRGFVDRILEVAICETAHEVIDANIGFDDEGPLWGLAWRARSVYWIWRHRDALRNALELGGAR